MTCKPGISVIAAQLGPVKAAAVRLALGGRFLGGLLACGVALVRLMAALGPQSFQRRRLAYFFGCWHAPFRLPRRGRRFRREPVFVEEAVPFPSRLPAVIAAFALAAAPVFSVLSALLFGARVVARQHAPFKVPALVLAVGSHLRACLCTGWEARVLVVASQGPSSVFRRTRFLRAWHALFLGLHGRTIT